jgi:hypothetical protein
VVNAGRGGTMPARVTQEQLIISVITAGVRIALFLSDTMRSITRQRGQEYALCTLSFQWLCKIQKTNLRFWAYLNVLWNK